MPQGNESQVRQPSMTHDLSWFFPPTSQVRLLAMAGIPGFATTAETVRSRWHDGGLLTAGNLPARVRRLGARLVLATGLPRRTPGSGDEQESVLSQRLRACVDSYDRIVALGGTPGRASKVTLVVLAADDTPVAYAKVGVSQLSRRLVQNEASVLAHVSTCHGPALIGSMETDCVSMVVTSPLRGAPLANRSPVPRDLAERARGQASSSCVSVLDHPVVTRLAGIAPHHVAVAIRALEGVGLPVTVSHGDAAPWNAIRGDDGQVRLFDWEYGEIDGLPLMDVAHWSMQVGHLAMQLSPGEAVRRSVEELRTAVRLTAAEGGAACLLVAILLTLRHDGERSAGAVHWWSECIEAAMALVLGRRGIQ